MKGIVAAETDFTAMKAGAKVQGWMTLHAAHNTRALVPVTSLCCRVAVGSPLLPSQHHLVSFTSMNHMQHMTTSEIDACVFRIHHLAIEHDELEAVVGVSSSLGSGAI